MSVEKQHQTEINEGITAMMKDDGELQIMNKEFTKERNRINTYLKSQSVNQQMAFIKLFKLWMDLLLELYDFYRVGISPAKLDGLKQIMWKIINDLKEL